MQPAGVRVARQGPACERCRLRVVGRGTPPELVLYGGVVWGTAVTVIVRERRRVTTLGVAVARGDSDRVVPVRFTEDEQGEVSAASAAEGVTLSAFLRARGVASAKRALRREAGSADG